MTHILLLQHDANHASDSSSNDVISLCSFVIVVHCKLNFVIKLIYKESVKSQVKYLDELRRFLS